MGRIGKNYIYSVAYQILVLIAPIITAPYLARVLGADNLGIYSYVYSSGSIITTISLLGIYAYGNRQTAYVRESKAALTSTFWELELLRLVLGTIGTVIYILYAALNKDYFVYFCIYYPYILAQFIDCSWVYVGLEDMKPAIGKNFVTKLINIIGIFLFVKSKDDLWIYIMLLAVTTFLANISIYTHLPRYIDKPKVDKKMLIPHLKGSLALFLPQVASLFYLQMDKVMLEWITGATNQVSFYDQAEKIVTIPLSLITVISSVVMPRLANEYRKGNTETVQNLLLKAGKYALCMALTMMCGIFCIARQFISWYLGPEFQATSVAIMILSPIILFNTLAGISGNQYFTATNQTSILLKAYVAAALTNIAVNLLLIPSYGYIGAAIATVLSSLISVITQYLYFRKQVKINEIRKYLLKYMVGALLMAVVITVPTYHMAGTFLTTCLQIGIGIAVYLIYLIITRDSVVKDLMALLHNRRLHTNAVQNNRSTSGKAAQLPDGNRTEK